MSAFDVALALVLKMEGGRVNNPADPGGRTNEGVTQATYDAWSARQGVKARDVYLIGPSEVSAIYRTEYADKIRFDDLPPGVGYCVFDAAVNSGVSRATKWLQSSLGVTADGVIGPMTLASAKIADPAALVRKMCDARLAFLEGLSTWGTFGKGWSSRVEFVRSHALAMIAEAKSQSPSLDPPPVVTAPKLAPRVEPVVPPVLPKFNLPPVQPSFWSRFWAALTHKASS